MRNWKIYVLINKINGKMYIGTTSQDVRDRWCGGNNYRRQPFGKAIKKYGWGNFRHIILIENLEENIAYEIEKELIKKYKTNQEQYGYNIASGGRGNSSTPSEETKRKLSKVNTEKSGKLVFQYSLDGKFLKEWKSASEIERELGIKKWDISCCCLGKQNKTHGYIWLHKRDDTEALRRISCKRQNLNIKEANEIRDRYKEEEMTFSELAKEYGLTIKIISNIINNKTYVEKANCQ